MAYWEFNKGEWTEAYVFLRLLGEVLLKFTGSLHFATIAEFFIELIDALILFGIDPQNLLI